MFVDDSTSSVKRRERFCVWVIYGAPVFFVIISASIILLRELGYGPLSARDGEVLCVGLNGILAAAASAGGEVFRQGSFSRRVFSGALYSIIGLLLYFLLFGLLMFVFSWFGIH